MANRENTGKYGKSNNYVKNHGFLDFLRGLSWGLLNRLKMLPQDVGTFSTIGQPILRTFIFWSFLVLPPSLVAKWRNGEFDTLRKTLWQDESSSIWASAIEAMGKQ